MMLNFLHICAIPNKTESNDINQLAKLAKQCLTKLILNNALKAIHNYIS